MVKVQKNMKKHSILVSICSIGLLYSNLLGASQATFMSNRIDKISETLNSFSIIKEIEHRYNNLASIRNSTLASTGDIINFPKVLNMCLGDISFNEILKVAGFEGSTLMKLYYYLLFHDTEYANRFRNLIIFIAMDNSYQRRDFFKDDEEGKRNLNDLISKIIELYQVKLTFTAKNDLWQKELKIDEKYWPIINDHNYEISFLYVKKIVENKVKNLEKIKYEERRFSDVGKRKSVNNLKIQRIIDSDYFKNIKKINQYFSEKNHTFLNKKLIRNINDLVDKLVENDFEIGVFIDEAANEQYPNTWSNIGFKEDGEVDITLDAFRFKDLIYLFEMHKYHKPQELGNGATYLYSFLGIIGFLGFLTLMCKICLIH